MSQGQHGELVPVGGGDVVPLIQEVMTIGRRESCDIRLNYQNVSGTHAELTLKNGVWYLRDLGSTNGVKVNSERTLRKPLRPGDEISIANPQVHEFSTSSPPAAASRTCSRKKRTCSARRCWRRPGWPSRRSRTTRTPAASAEPTALTTAPSPPMLRVGSFVSGRRAMAGPLAGKVALVTGASSGIGRAAAVQLARAGADVALNYLTLRRVAEQAAEEIEALGCKAVLYRVDVSDQKAVEHMVADAVALLGRLDVVVTSAVYSGPRAVPDRGHGRVPQDDRRVDVGRVLRPACGLRADGGAGEGGPRWSSVRRTGRSRSRSAWRTTWRRPRSTR